MRPSLWSGFFGTLKAEEALCEVASAGFGDTELSCEMAVDPQSRYFSERWIQGLHRAAGGCGITMSQVHYPILTLHPQVRPRLRPCKAYDPDAEADLAHPAQRRRSFEIRCATDLIELCPSAGLRTVVIHPGGAGGLRRRGDFRRMREMNLEAFAPLAAVAAGHGVTIAVENMAPVSGRRRFGSRIADLVDLVDEIGSPNLGVCLDTSHAHLAGEDIPAAVDVLGPRLVTTHISDNLGTHDDHLLPYSGGIEWAGIVSALGRVGYTGLFNLEIPGESACPLGVLRLKARHGLRLTLKLLSAEAPP